MKKLNLSLLPKTWLLDIDGTLVVHNGYLHDGDTLLDGAREFFSRIGKKDKIILMTSRSGKYRKKLEKFLKQNKIRFDQVIYDLPYGERILVNDRKSSGLKTAYAVNKCRDARFEIAYELDRKL
jgi:ribonucleotide monophosphatase NagD (HAD superfamily)